jgi:hypothetical protein
MSAPLLDLPALALRVERIPRFLHAFVHGEDVSEAHRLERAVDD